MADKFGGQKDGRQTTGATFYDVPAVPVNANALYFPNFPASPFFGVAEYPVAAGDLGAFSTAGVFVFDKPAGWIDNAGRKVFYRPKTAATGEIVAQEIKGDVFVGYQILDNINPQKLGVLLAPPEFCMNVLMVTSTADSGAGSLRQAIADAQDGDVILFDSDVFPAGQTTSILLSSSISINKSVSIYGGFSDGNGGYTSGTTKRFYVYRETDSVKTKVYIDDDNPAQEGETVLFENVCRVALDWQSIRRGFYVNAADIVLNFSGVGFYNGVSDSSGGAAIFNNNSQVTLNSCVFDNCSGSYGGAICFNNTSIGTLNNCVLSNCSSIHRGGAIYATVHSQCTLNNCVIIGCSADEYGGAIQGNNSSTVILNDCIVTNCSSNTGGAFAFSNSATCELNDCTITDCDAIKYNGGGVYITDSGHTNLNNCLFTHCSSISSGGGIYAGGTTQNTFNNCNISNCASTQGTGGVALYNTNGTNDVKNCVITDNIGTEASRNDLLVAVTNGTIIKSSVIGSLRLAYTTTVTISDNITTVNSIMFEANTSGVTSSIVIDDGTALTITNSASVGAGSISSAGRGYLATAAGIDISAATLTGVVACTYGAGLESFEISEDGASWTAQDLTTPILIETRDDGGDWQTLTNNATGGEYATTFALESTARAFDGVAFFVATLPGYWQADAGAADANDWSVKGFAAVNSNGGGDVDAAQGWTVTPSTVTPNADGV